MAQTNRGLQSLPMDIGDKISSLISPLTRANLGRALALGGLKFNFEKAHKRSARVWDMIFKDESWLQAIADIKYNDMSPPKPTLIGKDLAKLYYGSSSSVYIVLLISDWGRASFSLKEKFFASLREHHYVPGMAEIKFKNSNIILNISDIVRHIEWIHIREPSSLFCFHRRNLQTTALYYEEADLNYIGPDRIGGVDSISTKKKKYIQDICSLQLKFGDGKPVYRVITTRIAPVGLINIKSKDKNGREWVTKWREASF
jgi:hypothetical protein